MAESCRVNSIADLKALHVGAVPCLTLLAYYVPGDGGGGEFYWDALSNEPDDRGTIIMPASNPSRGRWKRLVEGPFSVKFFGAKGDGKSVVDGAILAGSNIVTSLSGKFAHDDVGKDLSVDGAGAVQDLITTIAQYIGPTEVSLATAASTGVAGATVSVQNCTTPRTLDGGAIAAGSTLLTVLSGTFTPADVEEPVRVTGAGAPASLYAQIDSVISSTEVRLNAAAVTDAQNAHVFWATDDTSAIQAAIDAVAARGGGIVFLPVGTYVVNGARASVTGQRWTYGLALRSNITFSGPGGRAFFG
jgi:hypothetical protein